MAYDEALAARIRGLLSREDGLEEKKMFGGLAFLLNGNMAVAASGQGGLLVRVDPAESASSSRRRRPRRWSCAAGRWPAGYGWSRPRSRRTTSSPRGSARCVEFARSLPAKR